jgi:hypothetical protein
MKTFGSRGPWFLLPLLATVGWNSCQHVAQAPPPAPKSVTENIHSECKPDDDWIPVNINDQLQWQASDGHKYSIHFKDRTPLTIAGNPAKTLDLGQQALVSGDDQCKKHGDKDTDCYFRYFLKKDAQNGSPARPCSDPGVHVTP